MSSVRGSSRRRTPRLAAVDVFCGVGGLSYGLRGAGIEVVAGIDLDPRCEYPFTENVGARFIHEDVRELSGADLKRLYPKGTIRVLAGCAPCRPFSPWQGGSNAEDHDDWTLLGEFGRLVRELKPGLVTMENVPRLASKKIFRDFVRGLVKAGYQVSYRSVYCPTFGIAQHRRRLVLVASLIGSVAVPKGPIRKRSFKTVRDAIGKLPPVAAGRADPRDRLHKARSMSDMLLRRVRASQPGGTWRDWPEELRAPCHRKESGKSYQAVYSRMEWDAPSPTITTLFHSFGSGRFGHPEQDRALTLREAAILQSFPRRYRFLKRSEPVQIRPIALLIGNAVPPRLGRYVGRELVRAARAHGNPTR